MRGSRKYLQAEEVYFLRDNPAIVLVEKGLVKLYVLTPEGRERILFIAGAGDYVGGLDGEEESCTYYLQAKSSSRIKYFSHSELSEILSNTGGALALLESLDRQVGFLARELRESTFLPFRSRLASALLTFFHRHGRNGCLNFSHQELADFLGVSRITVTRGLQGLSKAGLISKGRKKLFLENHEGLQQVARGEN